MITKRPDLEERIGEVSGSKRACYCRGLVKLMGKELMEKEMTTDIHRRGSRGSERDHKRKKEKEDAKANGIRQQLTDAEYEKELAEVRNQFNKLKLMIEEIQRVGWLMKKRVKWQRLQ